MGAAIIADVDAAPVLESAEHVLDLVPAAVERGVVRDWRLPVSRGHLTKPAKPPPMAGRKQEVLQLRE
jgi:hypothetical protein